LIENIPDAQSLKDPKTRLQELLQSRKYQLPEYDVVEVTGQAHNQQFIVDCEIKELSLKTQGKASSRRKAEQQAAEKIIADVEKVFSKNK
jgi:ribonuclease-3